MFKKFSNGTPDRELSVCGIPFDVVTDNGTVKKLSSPVEINGKYSALFFLGMSTDSWQCSEWWGQQETAYDHTTRLFLGDRVGRIRVLFDNRSEELISVIFGVNCFNYNLFYRSKPHEGNLMSFDAPYNEPFASSPEAEELLENALAMNENSSDDSEKMTKWVFCYNPDAGKSIAKIEWFREGSKTADFVISAITAAALDSDCPKNLKYTNLDYFLGRKYYSALDALSRRLYQYADELPASVPVLDCDRFDAPDIRFYNKSGVDIFTNVYRANIIDMAYNKVTDDGMPHTSSSPTANYGCYIGFGTYNNSNAYGTHVWTRDTGRMLIEIINAGYYDRARAAIDKLHEMLYYKSYRFDIPHWKRVANLIPQSAEDFNDGLENDGHASIMTAVYSLYLCGGADKAWLSENEKHLRAAADCYVWQYENPGKSGFDRVFYSCSETSTQTYGGYDLYSNVISITALRLYARLFGILGDNAYADKLVRLADTVKNGVIERFTLIHPRFGRVLTDTNDDCWTYEYKRFAPALLASDYSTLDLYDTDIELFDLMNRTFEAEKEVYYDPFSGRQMGYGQGYLTGAALALDRYKEYTDCINAAAALCYHHTDNNYIVPEGVIVHGSHRFWYRNSDLGNAVQQAEIVKCARLMAGVDDMSCETFRLVPRLPETFTKMEVNKVSVILPDGKDVKVSYTYGRGEGEYYVSDGSKAYYLDYNGEILPDNVRFGPFRRSSVTVSDKLTIKKIKEINGLYYVYASIKQAANEPENAEY